MQEWQVLPRDNVNAIKGSPKKMISQPCSGTLLLVPSLRRQTLTRIERLFFDPLRSPAFRKSQVYKGHKILQAGIFIRVKV
jgi:hypothetical protein